MSNWRQWNGNDWSRRPWDQRGGGEWNDRGGGVWIEGEGEGVWRNRAEWTWHEDQWNHPPASADAEPGSSSVGDTGASAQAAEAVPATAVAVQNLLQLPLPLEVKYTMAQLRAFEATMTHLRTTPHSTALNSTALKWIRDTNEDPPGFPTVECVDLTNGEVIWIGQLLRDKGMEYSFDKTILQPWSWQLMILGFSPDLQDRMIGPGLAQICCKPFEGSYDHKRHHAAREAKRPYPADAPVPIWDFCITRVDGEMIRFHPSLKGGKVQISNVSQPRANPPYKGKGRSDGPGTYRAMLAEAYDGGAVSASTYEEVF